MRKYFYGEQLFKEKIREDMEYDVIDSPYCSGIERKKGLSGYVTLAYTTDERGCIDLYREFDNLEEAIQKAQSWSKGISSSLQSEKPEISRHYFLNEQLFHDGFDETILYSYKKEPLSVGISTKTTDDKMKYFVYITNDRGFVISEISFDEKELALEEAKRQYWKLKSLYDTNFGFSNDRPKEKVKVR